MPPKKPTVYRNLVDNFIKNTQPFIDAAEQAGKLSKEEQKNQQPEKLKFILSNVPPAERKIVKDIFNAKSGEIILAPTSAVVVGLQKKALSIPELAIIITLTMKVHLLLILGFIKVFESDPELKNKILT